MVIPGLQGLLLKIDGVEAGECTEAHLAPPPHFTEEHTEALYLLGATHLVSRRTRKANWTLQPGSLMALISLKGFPLSLPQLRLHPVLCGLSLLQRQMALSREGKWISSNNY